MRATDKLFLLIKSLSPAEKKHFKHTAGKYQEKREKSYLRLFDAIDAQKVYDEQAIKKKFKGEVYFEQLARVKIYLHQQILKSLKIFYDELSGEMVLNNLLAEIEILHKKQLFRDCMDTIRKAKTYAEKYEKLPHLLKLIEWEIKMVDFDIDVERMDILRQAINESKEVAKKYNENIDLKLIHIESRALLHSVGEARTPGHMAKFNAILNQPVMKGEASTFQGEILRLTIKVHQAQFKRDYDEMRKAVERVIYLFDLHPHQIDQNIDSYFNSLVELTIASIVSKKLIAAEQYFQKLKKFYLKEYGLLPLTNKIWVYHIEVNLLLYQGQFVQALDLIPEINNLVENNYKELSSVDQMLLSLLYFDVYFRNRDFKSAQHHLQRVINYNSDSRQDIQSSIRILNLILQYEQREFEYLGYLLRSTYRYLLKKEKLYEPEKVIINFIRKATDFTSEKEILQGLAELREQYLPFRDEVFIIDFPIIEWIDSKLQKRELSEIIREGYLNLTASENVELDEKSKMQKEEGKK